MGPLHHPFLSLQVRVKWIFIPYLVFKHFCIFLFFSNLVKGYFEKMVESTNSSAYVYVTYMFIEPNKLALKMQGMPMNKPTPINLASHAYWNLGSHNNGDTLSHKIQIFGSHITSVNDKLIPTGEISPVNGTAYDFLKPRKLRAGSRRFLMDMISTMLSIRQPDRAQEAFIEGGPGARWKIR